MYDLRHGDCLEVMKSIPDKSVDLTVTSPPYDNLRTYNGNNELWGEHVWKAVLADLFRVTKQGGVVVWVVADATINGSETGTSFRQALWAMECGFRLHDTMIWNKQTFSNPFPNRYHQTHEYMFVFSNESLKTYNPLIDRKNIKHGKTVSVSVRENDGRMTSRTPQKISEYGKRFNVWDLDTVASQKGYINKNHKHPASFPLQLANDHIISWSNEGDTVLDCFMGSGTTGVACANTGRKFIGIELDGGYFEIAQKRIREAFMKPKQLKLAA